ncbi:MAG: glycosyltransferase family 39 protein [Thermodesulfobacteriota bacterium]
MPSADDRFYFRAFYGLMAFHCLLWFSLGLILDLHPDTADHWVWSRYLSWGYYEHPPMVAWVIRFFTLLLGNNQWAVQTAAQAVALFSFLGIFLLAREAYNTRTAFFSILILEATPLFSAGSIILHINNVCNLFYFWGALAFYKGLEKEESKYYYLAGLALGLALLSKVTAVLFFPSVFFFLLISRERLRVLGSIHLYLALFLAFLIFSPFLYWNLNHEWISFTAQLEKGLLLSENNWNAALAFWGGQPLILGPVLFVLFLIGLGFGVKQFTRDRGAAFLVILTVVPLLVFGLAAFRGKYSDPVWTDIGWPFGAILAGRFLAEKVFQVAWSKRILTGGLIFLTGWFIIGLLILQSFYPFLPFGNLGDRTLEMRGWRELGETAGKAYDRCFPGRKEVYILADDYQLAAVVSFYAPQQPLPYSFGKWKRNLWVTKEEIRESGALMVCPPQTCARDLEKTRDFFEHIIPLGEAPFYRQGQEAKKFNLFYCTN